MNTLLRFVALAAALGSALGSAHAGQPPEDKPLPPKAAAERLDGPPVVSAKGWVVADKSGAVLYGAKEKDALPIASTTKIMTAFVVLSLAAENPKVLNETVHFSEAADKVAGTTCALAAGDRVAVRDLLRGLMLPSGNDAAHALAEHFGERFKGKDGDGPVARFVAEMNRTAKAVGMAETSYLDPHGLGRNVASPRDLVALAVAAMKNDTFAAIVQTRRHTCDVTDKDGKPRSVTWSNTNRLLDIEGYEGIKTGTTTAAGSCLVSCGTRAGERLFVVVLGCTSNDSRYTDTRNLYRWAWAERAKN